MSFPSANVSDRLEKTFTSVNFNMMIMIIYALITIAIFGMWYYARYEGNFLPSPKKTFNPMMIVAIVILVPGTQFAANFIANLTGYIRPDWLQQYNKLFETSGITDTTFVTVLYSVILAPICEELIFRGVTMRCARKALPFALANLMQAALFGLFHLNWIQGIYRSLSIFYRLFSVSLSLFRNFPASRCTDESTGDILHIRSPDSLRNGVSDTPDSHTGSPRLSS